MKSENKFSFFDTNSHFYGSLDRIGSLDDLFINFIKLNKSNSLSVLDVGGGNGIFAKSIIGIYPNIDITIIDPSQSLLDMVNDSRIKKAWGYLPDNLGLKEGTTFDYIHVKEVFHHITGRSIKESNELVKKSLLQLNKILNSNGYILVNELFYEGYIFPTLSRSLVFYLLLLQNNLKIKIPLNEFLMGLDVCFYTRDELNELLSESGFEIVDYHQEYWGNSLKTKLIFIKQWGRIIFIAKKIS
jgi:ubiquinone/menaquinone biosynthesis C-methylase UbiE